MIRLMIASAIAWPVSQRLIFRWQASRITRAVAAIAGGAVFAQGLSVVTAPITSRIYGPADYGLASVFNSTLGVLLLFATLRYEMAIMLPRDEGDARSVLLACLALACVVSLFSAPLTWFCGARVFALLGVPGLYRYWWMLPPTLLGGALYQCLSVWALRRKDYLALSGTKLRQAATGVLVTIGVGYFWRGSLGLLLGAFCWMTMGVGNLGRGTISLGSMPGVALSVKQMMTILGKYGSFALLTTSATLFNSAGILLTPMLFSACYSQEIVGHFSFAQRIVSLPVALIGTAMAQVFIAEASDMLRERPNELPAFSRKIAKKMAPLAFGILLAGGASPWVFPVVFGARWKLAGIFAALLAVLASVQLIEAPFGGITVLRQRQGLQLGLGILRTAMVFATIWLPARLGKGPIVAAGYYTIGMSLMCGFSYLILSRLARASVPSEPELVSRS